MRRSPHPGEVDPIKQHRQLDAVDLSSVLPFGKVDLETPAIEPLMPVCSEVYHPISLS